MRIDLAFSPLELPAFGDLSGRTVVVIDALRATTTLATALAHGARAVVPIETAALARQRSEADRAEAPLLAGEARGLKLPGFDLGNSPREMTPEAVRDRLILLTTTNGTRTLARVSGAGRVYTAAFVNLAAVVGALVGEDRDVLIACAGHEGRGSLEDTVCGGMLVQRLENAREDGPLLSDAALIAQAISERYDRILDLFWRSEHGRFLVAQGLEADLPVCARLDALAIVPVLEGDRLVSSGELTGSGGPWT